MLIGLGHDLQVLAELEGQTALWEPGVFFTEAETERFRQSPDPLQSFGAGFSAMLRMLAPLAPNDQRAELFAGIFLVSYLAYGVPALAAGELIGWIGLLPTALGYSAAIAVAALVALVVQALRARR